MIKIGRNDPCPCGSGKKYKHCCERTDGSAILAAAPSGAEPLQIAIDHHQAGRLPQAEGIYRQLLATNPNHPEALYLLGMAARQRGNHDLALELIGKSLAVKQDNAAAHFNLGLSLQALGRLDAAAESYRRVLAIKPDYAEVHSNLGNLLQAQGKLDEAVESYRRAIAIKPYFAQAHSNLANVLHDQGRLDEAVASYRMAISLQPDVAEVHSNLGLSLQAQGKRDAAIESYRKALAINPGYAGAHFNLGLALQSQGRNEAAAESYRNALRARPDHAQAHSNLGAALEAQGRLEEAVASYRRAIELDPALVGAHNGMTAALSALVPLWHVPMMNDTRRNEAYYAALKAAITPDSHVFEIGTGAGLLSMMAARLGAKTVTTCEAEPLVAAIAKQIIADNALDQRIKLIPKKSTELDVGADLPQAADILVSEILSSELLGERVLPSLEDAKRRLLKPGAKLIPAAGSIMIALFGGEDIGSNVFVGESCGFDLRRFNTLVPRKLAIGRNDLNIEFLSGDVEAFRFDFESDAPIAPEAKTLRFPVQAAGRCYGIIQWIRLQMDRDTVFENHPSVKAPASGWQHTAYLFAAPVELAPGQTARISAVHNRVFPWFSLEGIE